MRRERRLLLIDGDRLVGEYVRDLTRAWGYEVRLVQRPHRARQALAEFDPDVVLLDLVLAAHGDVPLLKELAEAGCQAPVLTLSTLDRRALRDAERHGRAHGLRMVEGLQKPFSAVALGDALARVGLRGASLNPESLRRAVASGELGLHYQPQLELAHNRVLGVEGLLRWAHPQLGLLRPGSALGLLDDQALAPLVLRGLFSTATALAAELWESGHRIQLALNLGLCDLEDGAIEEFLCQQLTRHGLEPSCIVLELPEGQVMTLSPTLLARLAQLRERGFRISVDQLGRGLLSVEHLAELAADQLKIDGPFVTRAVHDAAARRALHALLDMSRRLGATSIVQRVEEPALLPILRAMNCDAVQGHAIAPPMEGRRLAQWLHEPRHERYGDA